MSVEAGARGDVREETLVRHILRIVRERTGTDFALYRSATVERRIRNRMIFVGTPSLDAYLDLLQSTESEAHHLLGRLTIKVSRLYRNAETFDHLRHRVIPRLASTGAPLRFWSIGCARGEEAYTLAMLLVDAGIDGIVHATDIDAEALRQAALADYGEEALDELPPDLAGRYLDPLACNRYRVCETVRRRVRFSRHDITRATALPGDSRFHLVAFRNVAIYLQREAQALAFHRVCAALHPGGYLCLGEAEWPASAAGIDPDSSSRKVRVFRVCAGAAASLS